MSQIEVDKVIPQSGTSLQIGEASDTITIPSNATLDASNATVSLPTGVGGTSWQAEKTNSFTAVAGEGYFINTTAGAVTATLPGSATLGDEIRFIDSSATADTHNIADLTNNRIVITEQTAGYWWIGCGLYYSSRSARQILWIFKKINCIVN